MIYGSGNEWREAPNKRIMLFGMSGLGKTHVSNLLRASGGWFHYSVDYRIVPETKKRRGLTLMDVEAVIASGFETSGFGSTQTQRIEIATENLWKGRFNLIVTVMDRRTRKTVDRTASFSILE